MLLSRKVIAVDELPTKKTELKIIDNGKITRTILY